MRTPMAGLKARRNDVTRCNDPMAKAQTALKSLRNQGATYAELEEEFGVNKAVIFRLLHKAGWSDELVSKLTGERWHTVIVRFRIPDNGQPPDVLVAQSDLRQCPITDKWFIPKSPRARYAPGLSSTVKRAARRDLSKARERYQNEGDWANTR